MNRFDALYYPQTVCLNEKVLKYLLLHFNRIWFLPIDLQLNPGHTSIVKRFSILDGAIASMFGSLEEIRYTSMYGSEPTVWDDQLRRLMATYESLEEDGICCPLKDERFEEPASPHPLKGAVDSDLQDADFLTLCRQHTRPRAIPPPDIGGTFKGGGAAMRPLIYPLEHRPAAICSERINTTLYMADAHNLVPVSSDRFFMRLFGTKLKRVIGNPEYLHERRADSQERKVKLNMLSWEIFVEAIPDEAIAQRSVMDIVAYKRESQDLHDRFWGYVSSLEAEIAAASWSPSIAREVERVVQGKVLPGMKDLESARVELWEKLFGKVIERGLRKWKVASLALGMALIPTLSYAELLWYATSGAAVALADVAPAISDIVLERRRLRRSSLFFLVNLRPIDSG